MMRLRQLSLPLKRMMNSTGGFIGARGVLLLPLLLMSLNACSSSKQSEGLGVYPKAVGVADETSAIQSLRTITTAEAQLKAATGAYGNFEELVQAGFLDNRFAGATPNVRGYQFTIMPNDSGFTINADPQTSANQPTTGTRHFFFSSVDNTIHASPDRVASSSDPAI